LPREKIVSVRNRRARFVWLWQSFKDSRHHHQPTTTASTKSSTTPTTIGDQFLVIPVILGVLAAIRVAVVPVTDSIPRYDFFLTVFLTVIIFYLAFLHIRQWSHHDEQRELAGETKTDGVSLPNDC
jgi:hypothetical protein